jgi:outer membrane protein assembly factor BamA
MWRKRKYCLWLLLGFACCRSLYAQHAGESGIPHGEQTGIESSILDTVIPPGEKAFTVRHIVIVGNKKTKRDIILREIPFKEGDAYLLQNLVQRFEIARRQLMNTSLFHEAIVALKSFEGYNIDVLVEVKERWYIFPVPYFKPVDRNLNQWLFEQNGSLSRVNYGAKLLYNNVTGRNDKLRVWVINGYTKQLSFNYDRLYIDKQMKWGLNTAFAIGRNRELNYTTLNDKQDFLKTDKYIRNFMSATAELTYRKAIKTRHRFGLAYTIEEVADTVLKLNPDYFKYGKYRVEFPEIYYGMTYYDVDYIPYPTKGYAADIRISKKGFTKFYNLFQLTAKGSANWPVGKKSFFSLNGYGTAKLPFKQPYFNQRLLGYSDVYMQGYEYYVIDGVAGGYLKASLARKLINFNIKIPGTKKLAPQKIPINIYGRVYGNTGYTYHPNPVIYNSLSNKMLYSGGIGIDIVTIYDFTFRVDWSFNQLGQNGIFLHKKALF